MYGAHAIRRSGGGGGGNDDDDDAHTATAVLCRALASFSGINTKGMGTTTTCMTTRGDDLGWKVGARGVRAIRDKVLQVWGSNEARLCSDEIYVE